MTLKEAVTSDKFSHARYGTGCWRNVCWIYHFDSNSPTGFILADVTEPYTAAEADKMMKDHQQPAALSPTEPR